MFRIIKVNNKKNDVKYITFKKPFIIWIEKGECEVLYRNESRILTSGVILAFNKNKVSNAPVLRSMATRTSISISYFFLVEVANAVPALQKYAHEVPLSR